MSRGFTNNLGDNVNKVASGGFTSMYQYGSDLQQPNPNFRPENIDIVFSTQPELKALSQAKQHDNNLGVKAVAKQHSEMTAEYQQHTEPGNNNSIYRYGEQNYQLQPDTEQGAVQNLAQSESYDPDHEPEPEQKLDQRDSLNENADDNLQEEQGDELDSELDNDESCEQESEQEEAQEQEEDSIDNQSKEQHQQEEKQLKDEALEEENELQENNTAGGEGGCEVQGTGSAQAAEHAQTGQEESLVTSQSSDLTSGIQNLKRYMQGRADFVNESNKDAVPDYASSLDDKPTKAKTTSL